MKALLIAGEASGDLHASRLMLALKKINPEIKFFGIGGNKMKKAGTKIIYPSKDISVVGFSEVLSKIFKIKEAKRQIGKCLKKNKFDFAVTIDFPGFNIPIARSLNNIGIPVFYFITPQVWAWGRWRSKSLSKYFKHLFVIYPFEKVFFSRERINSSFLGNPLLDIVKPEKKLNKEELIDGNPLIAILPGSRKSEIEKLLIPMLEAYKLFNKKYPASKAIIALHGKGHIPLAEKTLSDFSKDIKIFYGKTYDILSLADIAIVSSGTATIETGILETPMVIVYKLSYFSWLISKILVKSKYFGLVNILLGEEIVPELIQKEVNPRRIANELEKVYKNRKKIKEKLKNIPSMLGNKGVYDRVACEILSMAK
jgi:lipid-A-disaccharide synthase